MMPSTLNTHIKVKTFWKDEMKIESELGFWCPRGKFRIKSLATYAFAFIRAHERTRSTEHTHPHPLTTQKTFRMDQADVRASGRVSSTRARRAPPFSGSRLRKNLCTFFESDDPLFAVSERSADVGRPDDARPRREPSLRVCR